MSTEVKSIEKSVLFRNNGSNNSDIFSKLFKEIKEKNRIEKVEIRQADKERIVLQSNEVSDLSSAFSFAVECFQKNKVDVVIAMGCAINIEIKDDGFDAFDVLGKIANVNLKNVQSIINITHRMIIITNNKDYLVDIEVKTRNKMSVLVQRQITNNELCPAFEELIGAYYNTIHLSLVN